MNIEKRDGDGKWAPVLIVKTELRGLGFRNVSRPTKHDVEYNEGKHQYKFYMNDNQRVIEITHSEYEPLEVRLLADFGIEVNAQRVYEMKLTNVPEKVFINVVIISQPADAEKIIDGENLGTGQTFKLFIGKHTLKVQKEGYKSKTETIAVSESSTLFDDIELEEIDILAVQINSVPQGAAIYIDNQEQGITDEGFFRYSGTYELKLTKTDYLDIDEQIFIAENKSNNFTYNLIKNSGIINFSITPTDAILKLNGEIFNDRKLELRPGEYKIDVSKTGYLPANETVELSLGKTINKTYNLIKNSGNINFSITPEDAVLKLNGEINNERRLELRPGRYNIEISKSGYLSKSDVINLKLGEVINKQFVLQKNVGILQLVVSPSDAIVQINKTTYGKTTNIELAPGKYKIEVQKRGYFPESELIDIELDQTIYKNFSLMQMKGKLRFNITPLTSKIEMKKDGINYQEWTGMKILKDVPVGEYEVICKVDGYKTKTKEVKIELNKTITIDLKMEEGSDIPDNIVFVKGGTFQMGSNDGDNDEEPIHTVTVSDFYIWKHEVTQKEWKEIMGDNPSYFKGDDLPVEKVSWYDAVEFCNKKSDKDGLMRCYSGSKCDFNANGYRLPTEAEWEYASRGGSRTTQYKYSGSNNIDDVAWYGSNSGSKTHPIGKKQANELGIYDMSGNVWEWCWDWKSNYSSSSQTNPNGCNSGIYRVLRGGSWGNPGYRCRVAARASNDSVSSRHRYGFRIVRSP